MPARLHIVSFLVVAIASVAMWCDVTALAADKVTPTSPPTKSSPAPKPVSPSQSLPQPPSDPRKRPAWYQRLYDSQRNQLRALQARTRSSAEQLAVAQKQFDEVVAKVRGEEEPDPVARQATQAVTEARQEFDRQRALALRPLIQSHAHREMITRRATIEIRLDDLKIARRKADEQRLPFAAGDRDEIVRLSAEFLEVNRTVEDREDDALENHAGVQEADKAFEQAVNDAVEAVKGAQVRRQSSQLQAALKDVQAALASDAALRKEITAAKRRLRDIGKALATATTEAERAQKK